MSVMITDDNFEAEVIKSDLPVLVDFFAEWCGPCKMMAPTIDELAKEYEGKWKIFKCNIDEAPNLGAKFGIQSIPTIKFFRNGEVVDQLIGFQSKDNLLDKLG